MLHLRFLSIVALAFVLTSTALCQDPPAQPPLPCNDFDFLLGEWDLVLNNIPNAPDNLKGRWTAQKSGDGHLVTDEYRIFGPNNETVYLGETYRSLNSATKQWDIRFVNAFTGEWQEGTGKREGDEMHFTQKIHHAAGQDYWLRLRYHNISADHFSWVSERSPDEGKTWTSGVHVEATRAHRASSQSQHDGIAAKVKVIQKFDYEGNRGALKMMYAELDPYSVSFDLLPVVRYWRGFAMWRRAINGFNESPLPTDLEHDLTRAINEFDEALKADPTFIDAMIGEAGSIGYLMYMHRDDHQQVMPLLHRVLPLLTAAQDADPDNPRLLWVLGPTYWFRSANGGGGEEKAFAAYQKGLESVRKRRGNPTDALLPSWGEPELLMNLAWSNLHRKAPDPAAAQKYANEALAMVPNWHYVRDILLPQIAEAEEQASTTATK